jgi:hypothetical protein
MVGRFMMNGKGLKLDISNFYRNRLILAVLIGLLAGSILGLFYGYVIDPVEWVDAPMSLTRSDLQEDYLRMAIDSYVLYFDPSMAYQRWLELGDAGPVMLQKVAASPGAQGLEAINRYKDLVMPTATLGQVDCPAVVESSNNLCIYLWLGTVLVGGIAGVYFYTRLRRQIEGPNLRRAYPAKVPVMVNEPITIPYADHPVLAHTMMTYVMGDDLFDESISVENDLGDFLGECGIGIVHTVDSELPKKVDALDIWLFDKNEINTKSIVILSHESFHNDVVLTQVRSKGEPILAEIGREITIKTSHLVMIVRIVDMVCNEMDPMECSFFQRISMEVFVRKLD